MNIQLIKAFAYDDVFTPEQILVIAEIAANTTASNVIYGYYDEESLLFSAFSEEIKDFQNFYKSQDDLLKSYEKQLIAAEKALAEEMKVGTEKSISFMEADVKMKRELFYSAQRKVNEDIEAKSIEFKNIVSEKILEAFAELRIANPDLDPVLYSQKSFILDLSSPKMKYLNDDLAAIILKKKSTVRNSENVILSDNAINA